MKKTILAMILAGSSAAVCAQDTTTMNNTRTDSAQNMTGNQTSTGNYNAYGAANMPTNIQRNFQTQFSGASDAQWQQTYNGFWRATFRQNGQLVTINYAQNGESFMVSLPVMQSGVPQEIVNRAMELYGNNIYDITLVKQSNPEYVARDSMMRAMSMSGNTGAMGVTDSAAMAQGDVTAAGDTSNMGVTANANANTYGNWSDTTGMADIPRTIDLYLVRIIDNGILRAQRMNADGSPDLTYGTTMAQPMTGNMNMNNNMNQNNTTNISSINTNPPTYSAYYNYGGEAGSAVSTGNYAAKDSAAMNPSMDSTMAQPMDTTSAAPMTDTSTAAPMTDTTATGGGIGTDTTATSPMTDTTATQPLTDTTTKPTTDTTTRPMTDTTGTGGGLGTDTTTRPTTDTSSRPTTDTTGTGGGTIDDGTAAGTGSGNGSNNEANTTNDEAMLQNQPSRYRFENQEEEQE